MNFKKMWGLLFGKRSITDIEKDILENKFVKKSEIIRYYRSKDAILMDRYKALYESHESLKKNINYDMMRDYYKRQNSKIKN